MEHDIILILLVLSAFLLTCTRIVYIAAVNSFYCDNCTHVLYYLGSKNYYMIKWEIRNVVSINTPS